MHVPAIGPYLSRINFNFLSFKHYTAVCLIEFKMICCKDSKGSAQVLVSSENRMKQTWSNIEQLKKKQTADKSESEIKNTPEKKIIVEKKQQIFLVIKFVLVEEETHRKHLPSNKGNFAGVKTEVNHTALSSNKSATVTSLSF